MGNKGGRPSKLNDQLQKKICFLFRKGLTDKEVCFALGFAESTLNEWKKAPEFSESIKRSKDEINEKVESSLLKRALGYEVEETQTFTSSLGRQSQKTIKKQMPADPTSMIFFLKNRRPDRWREKQDLNVAGKFEDLPPQLESSIESILTRKEKRIIDKILTMALSRKHSGENSENELIDDDVEENGIREMEAEIPQEKPPTSKDCLIDQVLPSNFSKTEPSPSHEPRELDDTISSSNRENDYQDFNP